MDERAAFEKYFRSNPCGMTEQRIEFCLTFDGTRYYDGPTESEWRAWQARAALSIPEGQLRKDLQQALWVIRQIMTDTPLRRDWLDPDVERAAKALLSSPTNELEGDRNAN